MRYILQVLKKIHELSATRVELFGAQYGTFAIFGLLNYPFAFLILYYMESQEQENFTLRFFAFLVCFPLLFNRQWPLKIKRYLPLYWHISLLYCVPFFGTVMLCRNNFSLEWLLNMLLGVFLFILLVDWLSFLILLSLGAILGALFFQATGGSLTPLFLHSAMNVSISLIVYLYFYAVLIGVLFARNREKISEAKLQTVKSLAYAIAHEMRTPLASIAVGASNLRSFLPIYEDAYKKAQKAGLSITPIHPTQALHLRDIPLTMEKVSYNAQNIINMLLMKVKEAQPLELEQRSISECIHSALEQYPLGTQDRAKIHWDQDQDFLFLGKEEMFLHIFFNLLKNSLYQISLVSDGAINICVQKHKAENKLHFKDNGRGISKKILAKIFDRFVSGTEQGTGMGLAYCKMAMNSFGGDIECFSEEGQGAEFVLSFPKIKSKSQPVGINKTSAPG